MNGWVEERMLNVPAGPLGTFGLSGYFICLELMKS